MIIDGKVYCDYCYEHYGLKHKSICDNFSFLDLSLSQSFNVKFSGAVCDWCFKYFRQHFYDDDWRYWYHRMLVEESKELEGRI